MSFLQETGETLMPNLCGTFLQDVVGELSSDAEDCLVWVAGSTMGGGLNTVRAIIFRHLRSNYLTEQSNVRAFQLF